MMICAECKHHFGISKRSINIFSEQLLHIHIFLYFWCFVFCKLPYVVSKTLVYLIVKIYCNELYHGYNFLDQTFWFLIYEQINHG
jgi:hypothetical protein